MTEKHTPLPWHIDGYKHPSKGSPHGVKIQSSRGDGFEFRVALCPKHPGIDRTTADANAALIVRSVNALPELVKALEEIASIGEGSTTANSLPHIARISRAALSKVRG